jgi:hypothetical protein
MSIYLDEANTVLGRRGAAPHPRVEPLEAVRG